MAQIYTRQGTRCVDHPHRPPERRCSRCGQPFCAECLWPGERHADGTRDWFCVHCVRSRRDEASIRTADARARSLRSRAVRWRKMAVLLVPAAAVMVTLGALAVAWLRTLPPRQLPAAAHQPTCGELTRVRSVGAIGVPSPEETLNLLAYPQRATVRVLAPGDQPPSAMGDAAALVDECTSGWRSAPNAALPLALEITLPRDAWMQRLLLWQDPAAPRATWVKDFEVLAATAESGDDFRPLRLDRPGRLSESVEPQWFQLVQPPGQGTTAQLLSSQDPARYAQQYPDVASVRRLRLRLLSTYGDSSGGASLGEVAVYGPDLELAAQNQASLGGEVADAYVFVPNEIHALAGRPVSITFFNRSRTVAHTFVTVGQDKNVELRAEPGQVAAGQFIAAGRPGRYEFYCRIPGHSVSGLVGTIVVR